MKSILFVCLGNICRSPTAKVVFDDRLRRAGLDVETDSAGTIGYHIGNRPDPRSLKLAAERGLDMSEERARQVTTGDFERFDLILAMDRSNLADLQRLQPAQCRARVELIMSLAPEYGLDEVPDPYYGGEDGFQRVLDMLERAADRLVEDIASKQ